MRMTIYNTLIGWRKVMTGTDKVKKNPHIFVSWRNSLTQNVKISGRNS